MHELQGHMFVQQVFNQYGTTSLVLQSTIRLEMLSILNSLNSYHLFKKLKVQQYLCEKIYKLNDLSF